MPESDGWVTSAAPVEKRDDDTVPAWAWIGGGALAVVAAVVTIVIVVSPDNDDDGDWIGTWDLP